MCTGPKSKPKPTKPTRPPAPSGNLTPVPDSNVRDRISQAPEVSIQDLRSNPNVQTKVQNAMDLLGMDSSSDELLQGRYTHRKPSKNLKKCSSKFAHNQTIYLQF